MSKERMNIFARHPFIIGLTIRLILMSALPKLLDDGILLQGVKYTDIDYLVFTDAARLVKMGQSPFKRHTYRYTPFMALILSYGADTPYERYYGRFLFCVADALCGLAIVTLRRKSRKSRRRGDDTSIRSTKSEGKKEGESSSSSSSSSTITSMIPIELQDALFWLYNPLPINICTRGSAESFIVLLSVLATVSIAMSQTSSKSMLRVNACLSGLVHGLAIHAKLYPIIYTASFMAYLSFREHDNDMNWGQRVMKPLGPKFVPVQERYPSLVELARKGSNKKDASSEGSKKKDSDPELYPFPWFNPLRLLQLVRLWIGRLLLTPSPIIFLTSSLATFASLTYLAVVYFGEEALQEGLIYHFSRVDHRHNYSMFFYWIYLARARIEGIGISGAVVATAANGGLSSLTLSALGKALLLPQIVLLLYSSLSIATTDLTFALFVQTFFFVALNKVITAQYFTWYLVLLPLCAERIHWNSKSMVRAVGFLVVSILMWLGWAFCLEMKGLPVHLQLWMASIGFFVANVNLLRVILMNYHGNSNNGNDAGETILTLAENEYGGIEKVEEKEN